ncbi:MAG: Hpt domain-containing protein, partial [Pseudomonadota bacterium]
MDELLSEFLTESFENLAMLDVELVKLEQNPNDPDLLGSIFRTAHTIKGTCGFLGLPRLEAVAHSAENVLGRVRDGEIALTPAAVTLVLQALDRIKFILDQLEATEAEPPGDDAALIAALNRAADGEMPEPDEAASVAVEAAE